MNVSFQGINNLSVVKSHYKDNGLYRTISGQVKSGKMNYSTYNIKCNLTNDADGDDLQYFHDQLSKCKMCYQMHCLDFKNPNLVDITMVKRSAVDSINENFVLSVRDYEIMLEKFQIMPLVDFIINLTKKISKKADISEKDRKIVQYINESISKKAEDFIEIAEDGHLD